MRFMRQIIEILIYSRFCLITQALSDLIQTEYKQLAWINRVNNDIRKNYTKQLRLHITNEPGQPRRYSVWLRA